MKSFEKRRRDNLVALEEEKKRKEVTTRAILLLWSWLIQWAVTFLLVISFALIIEGFIDAGGISLFSEYWKEQVKELQLRFPK